MTEAPPSTARTLAESAEAHVVNLVPNMLQHLLHLGILAGDEDKPEGCEDCLSQIELARAFLGQSFEASFHDGDAPLSADALSARDALLSSLDDILPRLRGGQVEPDTADLLQLAEVARGKLQSAVAEFLSQLYTFVVATEKAQARNLNQSDATAVEQIDIITGKINLIAINASIEAARAGEVGKGFAVIASEIQELSRQSKIALDRIRTETA